MLTLALLKNWTRLNRVRTRKFEPGDGDSNLLPLELKSQRHSSDHLPTTCLVVIASFRLKFFFCFFAFQKKSFKKILPQPNFNQENWIKKIWATAIETKKSLSCSQTQKRSISHDLLKSSLSLIYSLMTVIIANSVFVVKMLRCLCCFWSNFVDVVNVIVFGSVFLLFVMLLIMFLLFPL